MKRSQSFKFASLPSKVVADGLSIGTLVFFINKNVGQLSGIFIKVLMVLKNDITGLEDLGVELKLSALIVSVTDKIIRRLLQKVTEDFFGKINELSQGPMITITKVRMMTNWLKEALINNALKDINVYII
jgi:hypothetical protein